MAKKTDAETLSKHLHDALRRDILAGRWSPGAKLQLTALSQHYETSSTVVREALTRLVGDRLVQLRPNRGFFVPELSLSELEDITEMRCVNEELAARLAIERGTLDWESELIAAHHTLARTQRRDPEDPDTHTEAWNEAHQAFHAKLVEACGVPVLIDLTSVLSDLSQLYGRWAGVATRHADRDIEQEHRDILAAALARDPRLTAALLRAHYQTTMAAIRSAGEVGMKVG
ncbi:GntR family transcriptional regulator [Sinomonas cellulolyticus]|jgi:DNA-binding GntR family transcriptional regulator|uniref:GntR family transcriptional regulator n=1 Tax=Sinomonas cellulolyticus TaxID=2801916 RepID=A0ABS1K9K5_9MICC|nr:MULTISPECIES: GntR family transcriptional regulator [Sinomonas]MBL0706991.1 GntR family transcriptional regulator [Sinomonas cellulolyticus]GHG59601.1 GntR family transcriptional regulator [Sinomonas sp. KCTC 49339]